MANKRSITLHFDTEDAKSAALSALLEAPGVQLKCVEGELFDAEWADVSLPRQRISLTNCGHPGPAGRRRCLGHCTLHP